MSRLTLSLTCGDYEITRPLLDGTVRPDGIDLIALPSDKERIFRLDRRAEVDVSELNVVQYLRAVEQGERLTAIPVFPHRRFRHGSIFVNTGSGIRTVADLEGRAVGIGGYEPAAAVWIRGILQDEHGLHLSKVDWQDVFGGFGRLPDGQDAPLAPTDSAARHRIDELLASGAISATVSAYNPPSFLAGDPSVARLFPDFPEAEKAYYAKTGVFPVMHVVTIKQDLVDAHPWIPASLFAAFTSARLLAMERLRNPRTLPFAFVQDVWREQDRLLGEDPWQYGRTEGNDRAMELIVRYANEQGITAGRAGLDSLFAPVDAEPSGPSSIV
ncbi:phosphate/phosphite/phosphonate ABC transporter substrate-binding protein [Amycolatopsis acidicola]|uniref:Phosphate/phosphite/phosphonate ABC transporter substrate-binding protein n=1 Tax=Amycolatopsis acidicola TaxID=2596893 RepID=A0A5N0V379_9PSEU|nr:phosphate/phosphite/phosphonate ABC transporter substrate-binding protein [Amycolatopsis acidicola]KAA9158081.1 phosphate/phosphite/phosphonate ABC transporter substrate-binding protein [Amycolatopsis acidicola]